MRKIDLKKVVWEESKHYVSWNTNIEVSSFGETKKEALGLYLEDVPVSKINKAEQPDLVPQIL